MICKKCGKEYPKSKMINNQCRICFNYTQRNKRYEKTGFWSPDQEIRAIVFDETYAKYKKVFKICERHGIDVAKAPAFIVDQIVQYDSLVKEAKKPNKNRTK